MSYERHTAIHKVDELKMNSDKRAERMRRALKDRRAGQFQEATLHGVQSALAGEPLSQAFQSGATLVSKKLELELMRESEPMLASLGRSVFKHTAHAIEEVVVKQKVLLNSSKPHSLGKKVTIKDSSDHVIVSGTKN